jgi:hypothetical protein
MVGHERGALSPVAAVARVGAEERREDGYGGDEAEDQPGHLDLPWGCEEVTLQLCSRAYVYVYRELMALTFKDC